MQLSLKQHAIILLLLSFSSIRSIAQQSGFSAYMKNDTLDLAKLAAIDSTKDAAEQAIWRKAFLKNRQEYFDRKNTSLYKLFEKLDMQGLKGFHSQDYEITTSIDKDSLQLTIIANGRVNYQGVTSLFKLGNIEKRFPRAWKLVKDRKVIFMENANEYEYVWEVSGPGPGGLTLPRIPSHLAKSGSGSVSDETYRITAEEFQTYIVNYCNKYRCDPQLMRDLEIYENTLNPKTWERRVYVRRKFVDFMRGECK